MQHSDLVANKQHSVLEANGSQDDSISDDDVKKLKEVELYSQSVAALFATIMERDKSILTFSVGGLGFLIALMNFSKTFSIYEALILILNAMFYISCIHIVIHIYKINKDYLHAVIDGDDENVHKLFTKLSVRDHLLVWLFSGAILLSMALATFPLFSKL